MTNKQPSTWELAADDVIAVMLNDPTAWYTAVENRLKPAFMPSVQHRKVMEAVGQCLQAGESLHDTTILNKCGSVVPVEWLAQRMAQYDPLITGKVYLEGVHIVKEHGLKVGVVRVLETAREQIAKGESYQSVVNKTMTVLAGLERDTAIKRETAAEIADDFITMMQSTPTPLMRTGITWLDGLTGGVDYGLMWWIAAPYKSRKSTVMMNVILGLLMMWVINGCPGEPPSIGLMSGEMPRKRVAAQMIAMLAVAYLKSKGTLDTDMDKYGYPIMNISPRMLTQAQANYRKWDGRKVEAVDFGIRVFKDFGKHLRVYDRSPDGGSLANIDTLESVIMRDITRYGGNIFPIDYLQIFKGKSDQKIFDYVAASSLRLQQIATTNNVTMIALAQQNEDAIKGNNGYSPGIKGGGDPAATADYLITSRYKAQFADGTPMEDNQLELTMKLSRHDSGGSNVQNVFDIHPASGLMFGAEWIDKVGGVF